MTTTPTRILLIEGDANDAATIAAHLAAGPDDSPAFALAHAPRLSTGCHLLAKEHFDAVLIDLLLPRSVGLEGVRKIRAVKPDVPVVVLTGILDRALAEQALSLGAQDYLVKGSADCLLLKRSLAHAIEKKKLTDAVETVLASDDAAQLIVDGEGIVRFANPAALAVLDRAEDELVGKPFPHPVPENGAEAPLVLPRRSGEAVTSRARPVDWRGRAARLVTLRTASMGAESARLQEDMKERLRVVEVKHHFMSRVAHELRNTLATLKTASYCLKEASPEELTPRQGRLIDMISRNVDRQSRIVDNILDLARFQSGRLKIAAAPFAAGAAISELMQEYALTAAGRSLQVDVAEGLPLVRGDADLFAQVLRNLLDNALRYAREKVTVRARAEDGAVAVSVIDDGAGIPPEHIAELFTSFVQLDRPAAGRGYKGTGLGLTVCKEIVEGHGGRIWADNAPGRGARFTFTIPAAGPAVPPEPAAPPRAGTAV